MPLNGTSMRYIKWGAIEIGWNRVIFMRFGRQVLPFEVTSTSHGLGLFGWYWVIGIVSLLLIVELLLGFFHCCYCRLILVTNVTNVTMATIACSDSSIKLDSSTSNKWHVGKVGKLVLTRTSCLLNSLSLLRSVGHPPPPTPQIGRLLL
jgi:hypothetical protein